MAQYIVGFQQYRVDNEDYESDDLSVLSENTDFFSDIFTNVRAARAAIHEQIKTDDIERERYRYTIYQISPIQTGEGHVQRVARVTWKDVTEK